MAKPHTSPAPWHQPVKMDSHKDATGLTLHATCASATTPGPPPTSAVHRTHPFDQWQAGASPSECAKAHLRIRYMAVDLSTAALLRRHATRSDWCRRRGSPGAWRSSPSPWDRSPRIVSADWRCRGRSDGALFDLSLRPSDGRYCQRQ